VTVEGFAADRYDPAGRPADEEQLIEALRRGDETAFVYVVGRYHPALVRLARVYVADQSVAEEVVQETWLGVLQGIGRFEGRSSLKTWIFRVLTNRAKSRARREGRTDAFTVLLDPAVEPDEPTVDPDRFLPRDHERWPGHWAVSPRRWPEMPEEYVLSKEVGEQINTAIGALPSSQQEVIILRDVEGWSAQETCNVLGISDTHQRVLLHRARAKVRGALEIYFQEAKNGRVA
jgi:RNA polymerase sigma-70 factor (ECF subfamily)